MKALSYKALQVKESSTLVITAKAKALRAAGEDLIAFTAGEPDFDTPQHIKDAAIAAVQGGFTKYTGTTGIGELRDAICQKLKQDNGLIYQPSQIVVSNGAKHALSNVFAALINEGDEVIFPAPYWITYPQLANLAGGVSRVVVTDKSAGYKPTAAQIRATVTSKTKAILFNSPNNPSGAVFSRDELAAIADIAVEHDLYIISDEIYEKLIYNDATPHISIASLGPEIQERTIIVNGYSKSYSMTGWRVGYTASNRQIAAVIGNIQSHQTSNINTLAQKAAVAAQVGDQQCIEDMRLAFKRRRDLMYDLISEIPGLDALKPDGAFYVFIDISALQGKAADGRVINDASDFADLLLDKQKVAVVPCADFGYNNHIRLSYASAEKDIQEGMGRIGDFIKSLL
ncbi:MAG: pyridoxal phosphate-dependent aminotransferase [Defluviitaleaceae bacterium]|nr:pyridoxal phosphate-dependent aminotransferase [Defluviitaleaceae bacterium]